MPDTMHQDSKPLTYEMPQTACQPAGKLKIFFGYAAGVGKTHAMLEAARLAAQSGIDVVVGYIAPHTGPETLSLLRGLKQIPLRKIPCQGQQAEQFDLDAALALQPELIIVDELAHENAQGARHKKRYQDVQELLCAGIHVYTTLNVQDLESLNDIVACITGVTVMQRIPDRIFDSASKVEVVDLAPADLLERFRRERICCKPQDAQSMQEFFTEKNLAALRQIALRRMIDRLENMPKSADGARTRAGEHVLVCLSGAPVNDKVIRTAARMAEAFHGAFTALTIESAGHFSQSEAERRQHQANLRLAEELGARIATIYGHDPALQIAEYAKISGISKVVLGRSPQRKRAFPFFKSLADRLGNLAPDLDIYIIPTQVSPAGGQQNQLPRRAINYFSAKDTLLMLGILALCTAVGRLFHQMGFSSANIIMIYILGVLGVSMFNRRSYSLLASLLSVLIFNFFFTYPHFSLMSAPSDFATFVVMFIVAFLSSSLTIRNKRQAIASANKAYRTQVLLETSQKLQKADGAEVILAVTATQLRKLLERDLILYPVGDGQTLQSAMTFPFSADSGLADCLTASERFAAEWVLQNNKPAGAATDTLPNAKCLYMAVRGAEQVLAVAGIVIRDGPKPDAFEKNLMVAILDECGLALEKEYMVRAKREIEETARREAMRANFMRAVSHDLRTPLTSISGNAGILMENMGNLSDDKRRCLYSSIYDDSMWLIDLVENLLSITRMDNGALKLNLQPELLEEVFQEALAHLDRNAAKHHISVSLPDDLIMAKLDARLIVQVVINIVNNAVKYTPEGSHITLSAKRRGDYVLVAISDDGPGIADQVKEKIFDMFYTADHIHGDSRRGMGLGLPLCRSIIAAHGGVISVADNAPHGACFYFTLHALEVNALE